MPRIRKKTSNRQSIADRHKLQRKVREGKKKKAKLAKKNPQWKSKHKKDPGIPNTFPYKDQILAEVAEQRRIAAEEKAKRKEEKRITKQVAKNGEDLDVEDADADGDTDAMDIQIDSKNLDVGADAIASLSAKALKVTAKSKPVKMAEDEDEDDAEHEVPMLVNTDLQNLASVIEEADVVVQVLDARDPLAFRSEHLEEWASQKEKKLVYVLNKVDLCPRDAVSGWLAHLRTQHPTFLFRSASAFLPPKSDTPSIKGKGKAKLSADDALGVDAIVTQLKEFATDLKGSEPLGVAIVGVTNSGKSALINSLLSRAALPVYHLESSSRGPTTTEFCHEATMAVDGISFRFIDTPGIAWETQESVEGEDDETRVHDILLRCKGRIDKLKDPAPAVRYIVQHANTEDLMLAYSLPAFVKGDADTFLAGLARSKQYIKKKGALDLAGASRLLLRDWNTGKLVHYASPPATPAESVEKTATGVTDQQVDEKVLSTLLHRKELRKSTALVRVTSNGIEKRKIALESPWPGLMEESDGGSDDDEEDEGTDDGDVEDEDEDDEEEEEEEEEEDSLDEDEDDEDDEEESEEEEKLPAPQSKRKRPNQVKQGPPPKKVAFAPETSKHVLARSPAKPNPRTKIANPPALPKSALKKSVPGPKETGKVVSPISKPQPKAKPTKAATSKPAPPTRVANARVKKAASRGSKDGEQAYDFSKFFKP